MNVIIHSLLHIPPLRDHLLLSNFRGKEPELLKRFAGLAKKIWNPRLFKSQVSPHEFLQEVNRASAGKFRLEQQGDPVEFLGWLLNRLHKDFGGSKRKNSSAVYFFLRIDDTHKYKSGIIFKTFQGELRVETQQVLVRADSGENVKPHFDIDRGNTNTKKKILLFSDI
jgi:U4/U6.U5 tri-snRNP-associated protein 2